MFNSSKIAPVAPLALATALYIPAAGYSQGVLEEVIVTAQKRSENVMDVPIAISVFDAELVEQLSARNLTDLGRFTAGVEMNNQKTLQPTYTIRGIETADFSVGSDPAIAVYVDGVYAARGAGAEAALVDLARVEVLKGPQGTLFGRNATGGAIHIISQPPIMEREGRAKLSVGDYGRIDGEFMINQPLSDDVALRAVLVSRNRDGFLDNIAGNDLNDEDNQSIRLSLLWLAGENTEALWRMEYSEVRQNSAAQHTLVAPVFERANPGVNYREFGDIAMDFNNREERDMFATSLEINHVINDMTLTSITGWREFETVLDEDLDGSNNPDYQFNANNPDDNDYFSQELRLTGTSERVKWTVGAGYSLEHVEHNSRAIFNVSTLETFAWAEILKGAGTPDSDLFLSQVAGLSPSEIDDLKTLNNTQVGEVLPDFRQQQKDRGLDGIAAASFVWGFLNGQGTLPQFGISTNPNLGIPQILFDVAPRIADLDPWTEEVDSSGRYESWAVYGDSTWSITDRVNLSAGLRYTRDDKEFSLFTQYQNQLVGADFGLAFYNNGQPVLDETQREDWENVSGRLVADYSWDNAMVYASIATGFKSGGFNTLNFGPEIDTSYDEEEVINYELGLKGRFFQDSLQLNLAGFFYEYDNLQELRLLGQPIPSYNLRNSDAEGYGLEIETMWLATDQLRIGGNYSWLETEYTDFTILTAAGETPEDDLTGEPRVGTPEHKVNLMVEYAFRLGQFGELIPRLDYTWSDERVNSLDDPNRKVDAFGIANARLTLLPDSGDWEFGLWSTNLFDEEVFVVFGDNGDSIGSLTGSRFPPRMIGADFVYRF
jgi:iron complex outermembrane receptor protein